MAGDREHAAARTEREMGAWRREHIQPAVFGPAGSVWRHVLMSRARGWRVCRTQHAGSPVSAERIAVGSALVVRNMRAQLADAPGALLPVRQHGSYLVDPASSHMLVSKIKPCMSKYKQLYTVKLQMAH